MLEAGHKGNKITFFLRRAGSAYYALAIAGEPFFHLLGVGETIWRFGNSHRCHILARAGLARLGGVICMAGGAGWCFLGAGGGSWMALAALHSGGYWCVDSNGSSKNFTGNPWSITYTGGQISCP